MQREWKRKYLSGSTNGNYHKGQIRNGSWLLHTEWEMIEKVQKVCKELGNKIEAITNAVITKKSQWNLQRFKAMGLSWENMYLWSPEKYMCPSCSVDIFIFTTACCWLQAAMPAQAPTGLTQAHRGYQTNELINMWSDLETTKAVRE